MRILVLLLQSQVQKTQSFNEEKKWIGFNRCGKVGKHLSKHEGYMKNCALKKVET